MPDPTQTPPPAAPPATPPPPVPDGLALGALPDHERPQERLERLGAGALRDSELLAMLLRTGTAGEDVLRVAAGLLRDAGALGNLVRWTREDFQARRGIGRVKALQLETVMEIARRVVEQGRGANPLLDTPQAVADYFREVTPALDVEKCWVLCLDKRRRLLRSVEATKGTSDSTVINPRVVFRAAVANNATSVVVVHNHPSGDPEPSKADYAVTRRLREAADVVEVELLDHVVLGNPAVDRAGQGWFSFRAAGLL